MSKILIERQGPVLAVTLNRPEARNAFDHDMVVALRDVFAGVGTADDRPRAVLLRAAGATFCAGGDLNDMRRLGPRGARREPRRGPRAGRDVPRGAAVPGAGDRARPGRRLRRGRGPGLRLRHRGRRAGGLLRADRGPARAGRRRHLAPGHRPARAGRARLHCLLGERIDAREAHRIGLVDVLAGDGGLDEAVAGAVRSLLQGGPRPWAGSRNSSRARPRCPSPTAWSSRRG